MDVVSIEAMAEAPISVAAEPARLGLVARLRGDRLIRNNAIYLTGSVGVGVVGYMFHFATGRLLGPATYAVVAAMVSALSLLTLPSIVLQTTAVRYTSLLTARSDPGAIRRLLLQLSVATLLGVIVLAGVLIALAPAVAGYLRIADTRLVYLLALASALGLLLAVTRGALQGLSRFVLLSLNTLLDMATRVLVAVGLILAGLGAIGAGIALATGPVIAYAQSLFLLRRFARSSARTSPPLTDVGRYTVSAIVAAAGITYLLNIDVILAKHYLPSHDTGLYAAGAVLGRVIFFLGTTVAAVMFPEVTLLHARGEAHFHVVEKSLLLLGILSAGFVLTYALLPGIVIGPFGETFARVTPYLVLFAIALSFFAISVLFVNYFLSINNRRFIVPLLAASALETVLIMAFHAGPRQVVSMVLLSMAALLGMLSLLYLADRFGIMRRATA
jgi:O-antigen/teichoic acid export membrane protein